MINYLADYSYFSSTEEMDEAAKRHQQTNWNAMNKTDRAVLDIIRRSSVKFGAAQLKHDTIANTTGKSNATIRRAIRKLEQLGIIDRIHYIRPIMNGLGANIYVIKPFYDKSNLNIGKHSASPSIRTPQPMESESGRFFYQSCLNLTR